MSRSLIHNICCPVCGHAQEFTAWSSINPADNPALRGALLEGQLEVFTCDSCKATTRVAFDTLYHDMQRKFMIWLSHHKEPLEAPDSRLSASYRFREVRSVAGLAEKIRVFEDQLDDRIIEMFKISLWSDLDPARRGTNDRLYYAGTEMHGDRPMEFTFIGPAGPEVLHASEAAQYLPFARRVAGLVCAPLPPHSWWLINEEYAAAQMSNPRR